jgi:predicted ATPase
MKASERLATARDKLAQIDDDFKIAKRKADNAKAAFEAVKDERMELFTKAYDHIHDNIKPVYQELTKSSQFPMGGQAYLDLEDSSEPYLAGIKYNAMPPLKRYRDMEHLSGGERTIAALALLFAIHSYQPSPFFVLDEVDAALDNVNVARVAKYVTSHARPGMQFIVISHKAGLFQESETLVGIMRDQAKMSSKAISLDVSSPSDRFTWRNADNAAVEEVSCCRGGLMQRCRVVAYYLPDDPGHMRAGAVVLARAMHVLRVVTIGQRGDAWNFCVSVVQGCICCSTNATVFHAMVRFAAFYSHQIHANYGAGSFCATVL